MGYFGLGGPGKSSHEGRGTLDGTVPEPLVLDGPVRQGSREQSDNSAVDYRRDRYRSFPSFWLESKRYEIKEKLVGESEVSDGVAD